ncbi:Poly(A) polymerase central domain-containing protein [Mycotypha africana]|uniref:Poly(A) polymerase central domain-containing protein n=1 Tax=Mycotypha africana TaxID=64632 RepID=UPI0022FFE75E|nr:Poly(A) polymerase central domain-containing protein [Mycotypha africana]KAI8975701.1 Poly(A) polymerase central domain-containing protein [Mycotypha africana]
MSQYNKQQQWGVTAPVSTELPTDHELKLTEDLVRTLHRFGLFESEAEAQKRVNVLNKLNIIVKDFVYRVGKLQGLTEKEAKNAGGKIFTFGSYKLGVYNTGADIDTLCVLPKHVERDHFFTIMYDMLKERPEVTELTAVEDAYVPVIRMHFSGIPIDFVCASLSMAVVPDDLDLSDNNILSGLDERCIRSLNGSRVTDEILRLVPSVPVFRLALRTIKLWAKKRAIYSNIMGFLGGVAWAMLVARVCQMYPNACAASIVTRFFRIMYQWGWPQPVILKSMDEGPLPVRQWNPKLFPADKSHRMPVITPAYPSMCATHNVTDSTRDIMLNEFRKSGKIAEKIMIGTGRWVDLFEETDFFQIYNHYLQIVASSYSAQAQLHWSGLVESKVRQLVLKLELVELLQIAHPYIKGFDKVHYCFPGKESWDAAHGDFRISERSFDLDGDHNEEERIKSFTFLKPEERAILKPIYTTIFYIGLKVEPSRDDSSGPRKLNLVWPTNEFLKSVKMWDKFDHKVMGITINNVKGSSLPEELAGKRRPRKIQLHRHQSQVSPLLQHFSPPPRSLSVSPSLTYDSSQSSISTNAYACSNQHNPVDS